MNPDRYDIGELDEGVFRITYRKTSGYAYRTHEFSMGDTEYHSFEEARDAILEQLKKMDWNMIYEPYAIVKVAGLIKYRG